MYRTFHDIYRNINNILTNSRLKLKDLDFVAFGCGPGRFTGLRIAASATQAISYSNQIPVCSVSSLSTIAQLASENYSKDKMVINYNNIYNSLLTNLGN